MKITEIAAFCSDEIRSFNQKGLLCGTYLPYRRSKRPSDRMKMLAAATLLLLDLSEVCVQVVACKPQVRCA